MIKKAQLFSFMLLCCSVWACNINQNVPLHKIAAKLEGHWVNQKYWDTLRMTKSPIRAHQAASIRLFTIQRDTNVAAIHAVLSFREEDNWLLLRDSIGLVFASAYDNSQRLHARLLNSKKLKLGQEVFVRYEPLDLSMEQALFIGHYSWNGKNVEFSSDGKVSGMEDVGVESYKLVLDYYSQSLSIDQLWLSNADDSKKYGFVFQGKKLFIYQLKCPNNEQYCAEDIVLGEVMFELKSQ